MTDQELDQLVQNALNGESAGRGHWVGGLEFRAVVEAYKEARMERDLAKSLLHQAEKNAETYYQTMMECAEERDKHENKYKEAHSAALAFQKLTVCYRVGKTPSEKLFKEIKKARAFLEKIDGSPATRV